MKITSKADLFDPELLITALGYLLEDSNEEPVLRVNDNLPIYVIIKSNGSNREAVGFIVDGKEYKDLAEAYLASWK